jgi:hypothetical protein
MSLLLITSGALLLMIFIRITGAHYLFTFLMITISMAPPPNSWWSTSAPNPNPDHGSPYLFTFLMVPISMALLLIAGGAFLLITLIQIMAAHV